MRPVYSIFFGLLLTVFAANAQVTFPENGVVNPQHDYYAFVNAKIWINAETFIDKGTLLIRDGRVKAVGRDVKLPKNTVVADLHGKYIYPSFIDLYASYGVPQQKEDEKKKEQPGRKAQLFSPTRGALYWNESVHPEQDAFRQFKVDLKAAEELREMGFGTVLTHEHDGVVRGTSALVTLGNERENEEVIAGQAAFQLAFDKGTARQNYPTSLMGIIALIRQAYYDADWYATGQLPGKEEYNVSLEAFNKKRKLPSILMVKSCLEVLRAAAIGREMETTYIIRGAGDEYKRIKEIKAAGVPLIVPLNFPEVYDVADPFEALNVSLSQLRHWEMAPANAAILEKAGIPFTFTADGLKKKEDFWPHIRKAVERGLSEAAALRALTTTPAGLIGQSGQVGELNEGKLANFLIVSENIFRKEAVIHENWIRGKQYIVKKTEVDIRGSYNLNVGQKSFVLTIEGSALKPKAHVAVKNDKVKVDVEHRSRNISLSFPWDAEDSTAVVRLAGFINDEESRIWAGKAELPSGDWVDWAAIRQSGPVAKADTAEKDLPPVGKVWFPNGAFGFDSLPSTEIVIFQNATIWTNEDTGILYNADMAIADGKILAVGGSLTRVGLFGDKEVKVKIVNAKGKHITSGIIDEHSHIAIRRGVNESGWNNTAEVRVGDVINSDDINIYRQLAGGVTAAQLLHGSANPIGGQSALIKLRWGRSPEEMKIREAAPFIKFALGENVKQSNWGDQNRVRFPQTRMGVEQVYYDAFQRAREYRETWILHQNALDNKRRKEVVIPPRRDLRLEALAEILDSNRFITCHSYVQSEINMLMHVADSMGFRVNTFTHVLEGYKLADKLREHGAGASTFSDWWAYKFEVNDAIPYNGAILHRQGVLTAFNSDDAEMGRRLNQEAAKAVKYGGVAEEDAWKFVTLNPAKLLHLDHRMGSLKVGKDADVVVWSDHPLSLNAKVEQTYIDGICYYDKERDVRLREAVKEERARLIQLSLAAREKGEKTQKAKAEKEEEYHCDTILWTEE